MTHATHIDEMSPVVWSGVEPSHTHWLDHLKRACYGTDASCTSAADPSPVPDMESYCDQSSLACPLQPYYGLCTTQIHIRVTLTRRALKARQDIMGWRVPLAGATGKHQRHCIKPTANIDKSWRQISLAVQGLSIGKKANSNVQSSRGRRGICIIWANHKGCRTEKLLEFTILVVKKMNLPGFDLDLFHRRGFLCLMIVKAVTMQKEMSDQSIVYWLQRFILEARMENNEYYCSNSIYQLCCRLQQALRGDDSNIIFLLIFVMWWWAQKVESNRKVCTQKGHVWSLLMGKRLVGDCSLQVLSDIFSLDYFLLCQVVKNIDTYHLSLN